MHIHETGVALGNGTHDSLVYLANGRDEHWVAFVLDFDVSEILFGDSLSGNEAEEDTKMVLSWWTHFHTRQHFTYQKLPITHQIDSYSCSLLSWNALMHWFFPWRYPLIDPKQVANERLKVLLIVMQIG